MMESYEESVSEFWLGLSQELFHHPQVKNRACMEPTLVGANRFSSGESVFRDRLASNTSKARSDQGMTLIELMIVVAIVGILASIAYPSYQEQVRTSRRADAQAGLLQLAQFMERYYTENDCYQPIDADGICDDDGGDPALPFSETPLDGNNKYYDLTQQANTGTAFTLRATPKGAQSGNGYLELTSTGVRRWDEDNGGTIGASEGDWDRG